MATTGQGVLRRLLVVFEFGVDTSKVDAGKKKLDSLFKDMQKVAMAFAGGAIAKGIGNFVKDAVDEMMLIRKGAQELRITTDEMQMLRSAGRALGMDVKWLHFSLERLQVSTELAARGSARQAASMQLLGLTVKKANGEHKSAMELFLDMADGITKLKDPSKQAIAVWDMFGRGGHRLLPMLRLGRERIEELMNATKEYGRYEKENIELAAQYTITLEHLRLVWTGLKNYIMRQWLPILQKQTEGMIKGGKYLLTIAKNSNIAKVSLYALQAVMGMLAIKTAMAFPVATALAGALVAIVAALDDLSVWWEGGSSLFGRALDAIFGKGESTRILEKAREEWEGILRTMRELWNFLKEKFGIKEAEDPRPMYGPEEPAVDALRKRQAAKAAAASASAAGAATAGDYANATSARTGLPSSAPPKLNLARGLLHALGEGAGALTTGGGQIGDTLARLVTGNWEFGQPALVAPSVEIGQVVVQTPTADPKAHGAAVVEAVNNEMQKAIKAAAASKRREKHP